MSPAVRITRIGPGPDGRCRFSEIEVDYGSRSRGVRRSAALVPSAAEFATLPAGLDAGLHPVERRQLIVMLAGSIEVGLADGETRRFARGDVFLADDEGTEGHTTRVLDGPVEALWLSIPEGTVWREVGTGGI